jgi:exosortase/archaeosortase family protein
LAGPLLLLLLEVGLLTPFVEFSTGPVASVASARVCTGLLFSVIAFLFISSRAVGEQLAASLPYPRARPLALLTNLGLYGLFFVYTLVLQGDPVASPSAWWAAALWGALALGVGLSAFLAFVPLRLLHSLAKRCWGKGLVAAGLGAGLALLSPHVQGLWPRLQGPAVAINRLLLSWTYGQAVGGTTPAGDAVVGTPRLLLLVTPGCSELDSLAAFWVLGGALLVLRRGELRKTRFLLVLLLGGALLYLLNAARIYGLVVIGTELSARLCVSLAHSRLGWIGFTGISVALLAGTGPWCRKPGRPACPHS